MPSRYFDTDLGWKKQKQNSLSFLLGFCCYFCCCCKQHGESILDSPHFMSLCTWDQGTWYVDQGKQHSAKRPPVKPSSMLWWLENQQIHAHLSFLLLLLCSKHDHTLFSQSFFFPLPAIKYNYFSVCVRRSCLEAGKGGGDPRSLQPGLLLSHGLSECREVRSSWVGPAEADLLLRSPEKSPSIVGGWQLA